MYDAVLGRFRELRPTRRGEWRAACPIHENDKPRGGKLSMALYVGRTGNLIIRCRAGCRPEEILNAIGVRMRDCFPKADEKNQEAPKKWDPPVRRRAVEWFHYTDETGSDLYRVVRTEPKGFWQEWRDGEKWRTGLPRDIRRVLFHLPQLLARPDFPVVVVEGERKVLRLEALGLLATCNAGGTGAGWRDSYSESLTGRRVVILPDNDPPGMRHADEVAGSLLRHGAAGMRIVLLPGLKEKGDVIDYLDSGGTAAELCRIIRGAAEWRPGYWEV